MNVSARRWVRCAKVLLVVGDVTWELLDGRGMLLFPRDDERVIFGSGTNG